MKKSTIAILIAPTCFILIILTIVPALGVVILSFFDYTGRGAASFVGIRNFVALRSDDSFTNALRVTIFFVACTSLIELSLGIAVASALELWPRWRNCLRILLGIPLVLSPV